MEQGRRVHGAEVWAAARAAYAEGGAAPAVCERFGLGLSSFKARAKREGWRRRDVVDGAAPLPDDLDEDLDAELEADGPADPAAMASGPGGSRRGR